MFGAQPDAARQLIENVRRQVVESLRHMPTNEKDAEAMQRTRELHVLRAQQLLGELEQAIVSSSHRNAETAE
jgi:hypothetical protein